MSSVIESQRRSQTMLLLNLYVKPQMVHPSDSSSVYQAELHFSCMRNNLISFQSCRIIAAQQTRINCYYHLQIAVRSVHVFC